MDINLDLTPWQSEFSNAIKPQWKPWRVEIRQWYKTSARRNSRKLASASWSLLALASILGAAQGHHVIFHAKGPPLSHPRTPPPSPSSASSSSSSSSSVSSSSSSLASFSSSWSSSSSSPPASSSSSPGHGKPCLGNSLLSVCCVSSSLQALLPKHDQLCFGKCVYILAFLSLPDVSTFFFSVAAWQKFPGKPQLLPGNYFWLLSRWAQHLTWLLRPVLANSCYLDMERLVLEICWYLRVWSRNATDVSLLTLKIRLPFLLSPTPLVFVIHPRPQVCMLTNSKGQKFGML